MNETNSHGGNGLSKKQKGVEMRRYVWRWNNIEGGGNVGK